MKKYIAIMTVLLTGLVWGIDYSWTSGMSGSFDEATLWTPNGVPGIGDKASVTATGIYQVSVPSDVTVATAVLGARDAMITLGLVPNTVLTVGGQLLINEAATAVGGRVELDGEGSSINAATNVRFGCGKVSNTVSIISGGCRVSSGATTYIGGTSEKEPQWNTVIVTGTGSVLSAFSPSADALYLGYGSSNNTLIVERGGVLRTVSSTSLGFRISTSASGSFNEMIVRNGGRLESSNGVHVGRCGRGNKLIIDHSSAFLGGDVIIGNDPSALSNQMVIVNSDVQTAGKIYVGQSAGTVGSGLFITNSTVNVGPLGGADLRVGYTSVDRAIAIVNNSLLNSAQGLIVGTISSHCQLEISGTNAVLNVQGNDVRLGTGKDGSPISVNNAIIVSDGGMLTYTNTKVFRVGYDLLTRSNVLNVCNGTVTNTGNWNLGGGGGLVLQWDGKLRISGTNSSIVCETFVVTNEGAHVEFNIHPDGHANVPLWITRPQGGTRGLQMNEQAAIQVNAKQWASQQPGREVALMRVASFGNGAVAGMNDLVALTNKGLDTPRCIAFAEGDVLKLRSLPGPPTIIGIQ